MKFKQLMDISHDFIPPPGNSFATRNKIEEVREDNREQNTEEISKMSCICIPISSLSLVKLCPVMFLDSHLSCPLRKVVTIWRHLPGPFSVFSTNMHRTKLSRVSFSYTVIFILIYPSPSRFGNMS